MGRLHIGVGIGLLLAAMLACAPAPARQASPEARTDAPTGPKRITVVVPNEIPFLYYTLAPASTRSGGGILYDLVHPGLSGYDNEGRLHALLVEDVPSVENGLWRVAPDGRMQTTWRLKPGAKWHDGTPLTSDDLRFTIQVMQDRELAGLRNRNYDLIEGVETPDARTVTLSWTRPFIDADRAFGFIGNVAFALPVPKHILETAYQTSKVGFLDLPYWSQEFVGFGPFKLDQWARGSHMIVVAFDGYVLGRPKIDEVEAKFIPDQNTIISNALAGSVDLFRGATLGVDQGLQIRDQWKGGRVPISLNNWVCVYVQFVNPSTPVVLNVQLRRALLHAVDRQAMADTLMAGLVPVAHSPLDPSSREYAATEASAIKYDFDPRRAAELIEGIGFAKGADGVFRDNTGQPLNLEIRGAASRDIHVKALFPVADFWQRVGVAADPVVISAQQASDIQDQATFRAFQLVRQDYHLARLVALHSSEARLPERSFSGTNNGRYMNAEMDALIERYNATIPWNDRVQVVGQILRHVTDQLPVLPLFYDMEVALVSNRVDNVTPLLKSGRSQMWNAHTWEVKGG